MNKDLTKPIDNLSLQRIKVLLEDLNTLYQSNVGILEYDILSYYNNAITLLFDSYGKSITNTSAEILPGSPADPTLFNELIRNMYKDLRVLFLEIHTLDQMITANFNSVLSERDKLIQETKVNNNKLGDYLLYASPSLGAGYFFGDSFNTGDKLDFNSSLIEGDKCFHSPDEGIILLPLEGDPIRPEVEKVIINDPSNGTVGNNHQIGIIGHNAIEALLDGEPNSWFEYEKVSSIELNNPLVLDITIVLKELTVINHININPVNFGTPTPISIITIDTSREGKIFQSIKDEIPIKDFVSINEDNIFELSPVTCNGTGQGFYSFMPRKAKYIHVVLHQYTPYSIETINGTRLRYAIGIRDINVFSRKFKASGSVVSTKFNSVQEIKKVSMWAAENPVQASVLSDISHFVSYNDGGNWTQLQPQERGFTNIPEVVNFNNSASNAILTSEPVKSLRHKISMTRNKEAFNGEITLDEAKESKLEIINLPTGQNLSITLQEKPIESSITLVIPYLGSFSCPRASQGTSVIGQSSIINLDQIEFAVDVPAARNIIVNDESIIDGSLIYKLPFKKINNLGHKIRVFLNGAQIEYCPKSFTEEAIGPISEDEITQDTKVYFLNKNGQEIQFGYKDSDGIQRGFIPASGSRIGICLDGDNPNLSLTDEGYNLHLSYPSDGQKDLINIVAVKSLNNSEAVQYEVEIPVGVKTYQIPIMKENLFSDGTSLPFFLDGTSNFFIKEFDLEGNLITDTALQGFKTAVSYYPGQFDTVIPLSNLQFSYSFDTYTGTIFLGAITASDRKTVFVCKKLDTYLIPQDKWEFKTDPYTDQIDPQTIILDPTVVYTLKGETEINIAEIDSIGTGTKAIALISTNESTHSWHNKFIVKGTVKPEKTIFSASANPIEVAFINGIKEFSNIIEVKDEIISFSVGEGENLYSFTLSQCSSTCPLLAGSTIFNPIRSTTIASLPTELFDITKQKSSSAILQGNGEWKVETEDGISIVSVYSDTTPGNYSVSYKIEDLNIGINKEDMYSIDYNNNIIYFGVPIKEGNITFEYSMYSAFYNIGEIVNNSNIESVNSAERTITFSPEYGLKNIKQDTINKSKPNVIKVLYKYYKSTNESLADLEPYFSPICKDLAFRSVTTNLLGDI